MGLLGGIGNALKGVGSGAAGLVGKGGRKAAPSGAGSSVGTVGLGGDDWGAGLAGMGGSMGAMANPDITNENIRTMKNAGMNEADAVRKAVNPAMMGRIMGRVGAGAGMPGVAGGMARSGGQWSAPGTIDTPGGADMALAGGQVDDSKMSQEDAVSGPAMVSPSAGGGPMEQLLMQRAMGQARGRAGMGGGSMAAGGFMGGR